MLSDELITIRPFHLDDVEAMYSTVIESREHLQAFLPWVHDDYSKQETLSWVKQCIQSWETRNDFAFVIQRNSDGVFLGGVGLHQISWLHHVANMGYWLSQHAAGQGIAFRAGELAKQFAFEELGLHRLEIMTLPTNTRSQRLAERLGGVLEGVLRERFRVPGGFSDAMMYSLLNVN